jgi:hypothetical protein
VATLDSTPGEQRAGRRELQQPAARPQRAVPHEDDQGGDRGGDAERPDDSALSRQSGGELRGGILRRCPVRRPARREPPKDGQRGTEHRAERNRQAVERHEASPLN